MQTLVLLIHLISCLILILVILLQSGKSADLASAFGVMGSQTAFGPRGTATLLSKLTTGAAIVFMVTSLALSLMMSSSSGGSSIMDRAGKSADTPTPAEAAAPAPKQAPAPAPTATPAATPAQPAAAQPAPQNVIPGGKVVDYKDASGNVQSVQVKQLSKEEVEAMMKGKKYPGDQAQKPAQKPEPAKEPPKK
jgi:preprotein translocase subunit SecG